MRPGGNAIRTVSSRPAPGLISCLQFCADHYGVPSSSALFNGLLGRARLPSSYTPVPCSSSHSNRTIPRSGFRVRRLIRRRNRCHRQRCRHACQRSRRRHHASQGPNPHVQLCTGQLCTHSLSVTGGGAGLTLPRRKLACAGAPSSTLTPLWRPRPRQAGRVCGVSGGWYLRMAPPDQL